MFQLPFTQIYLLISPWNNFSNLCDHVRPVCFAGHQRKKLNAAVFESQSYFDHKANVYWKI